MLALWTFRRLLLIPCAGAIACSTVIIDDWGTSGYARVSGVIRNSAGSPLSGVQVGLGCGLHAPEEFYDGNALTGSDGAYLIEAEAPGVYGPPQEDGIEFMCHLQARRTTGETVVDSAIALRFAPTRETAALVVVNLQQR